MSDPKVPKSAIMVRLPHPVHEALKAKAAASNPKKSLNQLCVEMLSAVAVDAMVHAK